MKMFEIDRSLGLEIHFSVSILLSQEPRQTSNTKKDVGQIDSKRTVNLHTGDSISDYSYFLAS